MSFSALVNSRAKMASKGSNKVGVEAGVEIENWVELHGSHLLSLRRILTRFVPEFKTKMNQDYFMRYMFRNHNYSKVYASYMAYPQAMNIEESTQDNEKSEDST